MAKKKKARRTPQPRKTIGDTIKGSLERAKQAKRPVGFPPGKHNPHKDPGNDERRIARRTRALELRIAGYTFAEAAKALTAEGFECSTVTAHKDVQIALAALEADSYNKGSRLKQLELARLDAQTKALWPARADAQSARVLVNVSARRAKLAGLDAPLEIGGQGAADAAVSDLLARLPQRLVEEIADALEDDDEDEA